MAPSASSALVDGSLVYHVRPTDPISVVAAIALMTLVAVSAAAMPVRQALSIDPADTLRTE